MLTIHGACEEYGLRENVPVAFALLTGKTMEQYEAAFTSLVGHLKPKYVVCDFEAALQRTCREAFPHAAVSGCAFHWTSAVFKRLRTVGLSGLYGSMPEFKAWAKKLLALPYVPAASAAELYSQLKGEYLAGHAGGQASLAHVRDARRLFAYLEAQWVGPKARVPPAEWSVYGLPTRTSNAAEGYHNRLRVAAGHEAHPPLPRLVNILEKEASKADAYAISLSRGAAPRKRQQGEQRRCDKRVHSLWSQHQQKLYTDRQLLEACAHAACDPYVDQDDALRCPDLDQ